MTATCCSKPECCRVPVTLILLLIYIGYLMIGAAVFYALENKNEQVLTNNYMREKWTLLRNHTCMDNETLELFISGVIKAYKSGIILLGNQSGPGTWTYSGSFFFSVTAITSIGYGNVVPTTVGGQMFCVFFALFGIPLNLILLNRIGKRMLDLVHRCSSFLGNKSQRKRTMKMLANALALIFGLLLFFLLPPFLFTDVEGWTYLEGFYYSFITLSTIGFGDYVVGRNPNKNYPNWYRDIVSLWILLGMAWLALLINLCINVLESNRDVIPCCTNRHTYQVDQVLIEASDKGHLPSGAKEKEDLESSTTKPKSLD